MPLRAIAVMSFIEIFYHVTESTMHGGKSICLEARYRSTRNPSVTLANHFLAESVNSCNIREYDYKLGWSFELWHVYKINTFTWHLG